jgi:hypothetical protein
MQKIGFVKQWPIRDLLKILVTAQPVGKEAAKTVCAGAYAPAHTFLPYLLRMDE